MKKAYEKLEKEYAKTAITLYSWEYQLNFVFPVAVIIILMFLKFNDGARARTALS